MAFKVLPDGKFEMSDAEKKSLMEEMESQYKMSISETRLIRRRWYAVERYLEGVQWSSTGETGWTFFSANLNARDNDSVDVDENVVIDNIMLRIHITNVARLMRYKPQIEISPNNKTSEDNLAVRRGRVALYDLLYKNDWTRLANAWTRHLNAYGTTFMKVVYDPRAGRTVKWPKLDEAGNPIRNPETGEPETEMRPEGMVRIFAVNPKNLHFPEGCLSLEEADWVQESNVRTVSYVKRSYGVVVEPEPVTAWDVERSGTWDSVLNSPKTEAKDQVIVKERWYRPCEKFPQGAIVTWAHGVLLQCKPLEKWYSDIPYFQSTNVFNDQSIYGDCPAYHLITHQNEVNRSESNIARHVNLLGKPKLLLNKDAQVGETAFTNQTGEIVEYSGNVPPQWLVAAPVSQALYEHINRHTERMMAIGYAHDIIRPEKARSGNAIAYEQEIDETTMAPMVQSYQNMVERGLEFALRLMAKYYKIPRLVKMLDANAWQIERDFKGDDLYGNFDVRVNMMSGLPANKLARQQYVMQLYEKGLLEKPLAQKYLEVGEAEDALREQAIELEVAQNVVALLAKGMRVPNHEWDNHTMMILVLEKWLRENWEGAPEKILALVEAKLKWHKEYLALLNHPANKLDGGAPGMGPAAGAVPGPGPVGAGRGRAISPEAPEAGNAPSPQSPDQQPAPGLVPTLGPDGGQNG